MNRLSVVKKLYERLHDYGYFILDSSGNHVHPQKTSDWDYINIMQDPKDFDINHGGDCWGYAAYIADFLSRHSIPYTPYCLICEKSAEEAHNGWTPASHTFIIVNTDADEYYYIECAHKRHMGLFGPFKTNEEGLSYALNMLQAESPHGVKILKYGIYEPLNELTYGMSQKDYVEYLERFAMTDFIPTMTTEETDENSRETQINSSGSSETIFTNGAIL